MRKTQLEQSKTFHEYECRENRAYTVRNKLKHSTIKCSDPVKNKYYIWKHWGIFKWNWPWVGEKRVKSWQPHRLRPWRFCRRRLPRLHSEGPASWVDCGPTPSLPWAPTSLPQTILKPQVHAWSICRDSRHSGELTPTPPARARLRPWEMGVRGWEASWPLSLQQPQVSTLPSHHY